MIFLDPFWEGRNLTNRHIGFSSFIEYMYERSAIPDHPNFPEDDDAAKVSRFEHHNPDAEKTVLRIIGVLGGDPVRGAAVQFFQDHPPTFAPVYSTNLDI
jgi:hypothetical protein